ncbi:MAG: DMT family transporter [Parachlamydiales bacterium]|nr:DMT family transporter [Parachlamydiales bacterium]
MQKSNILLGIIITIIAYLFFAISATFVRILSSSLPAIEIVFFQNLTALFILIPYCYKRNTLSFQKKDISTHLIRDIMGMLSYLGFFFAIQKIGLINATLLSYTAPFFTPFVWKIWMKEKVEKHVWWAIILGFGGIAIILHPGSSLLKIGALMGLLSGIFTSISLVAIRILNMKNTSRSRALLYFFFVGAIISFPMAIAQWKTPTLQQFFFAICVGVFITIGQILLTTAYQYGTASFLSPLCYFMVIFTGLISWIVFQQPPGWENLIGAFLIILGGTFTLILRGNPKNLLKVFEHPEPSKKEPPR